MQDTPATPLSREERIVRLIDDIVSCADAGDGGKVDARKLCLELVAVAGEGAVQYDGTPIAGAGEQVKWRLTGGPFDGIVFVGRPGRKMSIPRDGRHHIYEATGVIEAQHTGDVDSETLLTRMHAEGNRFSSKAQRLGAKKRGPFRRM